LNTTFTARSTETALALVNELERVRLELERSSIERDIEELRSRIIEEETAQQSVQNELEQRIGNLKRDVESLASVVSRLEFRVKRLNVAHKPLSDTELDDEEQTERAESAAFWAEWRQQRNDRQVTAFRDGRRPGGKKLLSVYRKLARLIHPDLARSEIDRARREVVMRIANVARDAGDTEQLQRLITLWSVPDDAPTEYDLSVIAKRIADCERELADLEEQYKTLRESVVGRLSRKTSRERERYFKNEDATLRRDLANLRLRRRRLLRTLDDRRRELSEVSD
jgi:predicted  nucleic acid-binding Zn-ribbon protein